jgi:hypothetical protein
VKLLCKAYISILSFEFNNFLWLWIILVKSSWWIWIIKASLWLDSSDLCWPLHSLFQWMRQMWQSDACYASYGVDGSECSFLMYLSEVCSSVTLYRGHFLEKEYECTCADCTSRIFYPRWWIFIENLVKSHFIIIMAYAYLVHGCPMFLGRIPLYYN